MKNNFQQFTFKFSALLLLTLLLVNCKKESSITLNSNVSELNSNHFKMNDLLTLTFEAKNYEVDSLNFTLNDSVFHVKELKLDSTIAHLGENDFRITYFYDKGKEYYDKGSIKIYADEKAQELTFSVVKKHPHNSEIFTEGFFYENGTIYESSGLNDKSFLCKYPLGSESYTKKVAQEAQYFSEGISKLGNAIYQLTWQKRAVFQYDFNTFELVKTLELPSEIKEGWGMTTNGTELIISDGSNSIYFVKVEEDKLKVVKTIHVASSEEIFIKINELELVNGFLYANIWETTNIVKINPENGAVVGILNAESINQKKSSDDVLNGIAQKDNHLLLTGKYWDTIFEVEIK